MAHVPEEHLRHSFHDPARIPLVEAHPRHKAPRHRHIYIIVGREYCHSPLAYSTALNVRICRQLNLSGLTLARSKYRGSASTHTSGRSPGAPPGRADGKAVLRTHFKAPSTHSLLSFPCASDVPQAPNHRFYEPKAPARGRAIVHLLRETKAIEYAK